MLPPSRHTTATDGGNAEIAGANFGLHPVAAALGHPWPTRHTTATDGGNAEIAGANFGLHPVAAALGHPWPTRHTYIL
ncbi:hypothetical protein [Teredinibacter haidensis]|uniref:hypothetical protein n=1 Tax=Teredinibacter haidensis TaxID=2731755 RepID=UPI00163D34BB|nr:hypothetical protein [Teredinibacter haidensis]